MKNDQPLDDIRSLIDSVPSIDMSSINNIDSIIKENDLMHYLGVNVDNIKSLAGWQGIIPKIKKPLISIFAGTHGVAESVFDKDIVDIAKEGLKAVSDGSSGVRGIAKSLQAAFKVYELGVEYPSTNFTKGPSLSEKDCAAAIAFGMEVVAEGADIIAIGCAGLETNTAAIAIAISLYEESPVDYFKGNHKKNSLRLEAVENGILLHKDSLNSPLDILRCYGGRDIAGMLGAIIAARHQCIPVILDGFSVCIAAAVLHSINEDSISHCFAGHVTTEWGHKDLLDRLGLSPIHDMGIGIGDGTGAAFALNTMRLNCEALSTIFEK
ncbi:MAG: nicotinate-nucleotide--dimethylbenzimidazole phosphoribosyltransferase [Hellea sp.]|nr:nicotinate-nucleotide--dimethylbenzimidazole phosphoribosyltransferase [Hellea sp.]